MKDHDREREELIQRLVQDSSDMLYRMSIPDGVCEYVSPACLEITGYCAEEIYSTPKFIKKTIHPDWRDHVKLQWENALKGKIEPDIEYKIIDKSGDERWLHQRSRLVCEEGGSPTALEGYVSDVTERKLAELALRESEQRFRDLAENSTDWIWELDTRMTYTYANQRIMDVLGYTPAEILGKTMFDFIPGREVPALRQYIIELQKNPHSYRNYEYRCLHKDGSLRILEGNGIPIYDSAGRWQGYRGIDRDITDRKKADEELLKSEAKYRSLAEKTSDLIWTADLDLNVTYQNQAVKKVLGFTVEERMGQKPSEIMTPKSYEKAMKTLAAELERDHDEGLDPDRTARLELEFYHKDGSVLWMECEVSAIRNASGDVIGLHGVSRNISDRKRKEKELKESEQRLNAIFKNAADGILLADIETTMFFMGNKKMSMDLGYSPEEFKSMSIKDIHPAEHLPHILDLFRKQALRKIKTAKDIPVKRKDGSVYYVDINFFPLSFGEKTYLAGVFRDITDRKLAEEELKKHRDHLDALVKERTTKLTKAHDLLKLENEKRKTTEAALRAREKELKKERQEVNEVNAALKVLLKQREQDKTNMGEDIVSNIRVSVLPLLEKLGNSTLDASQREVLAIARSRLNEITSPFTRRISSEFLSFTPSEIKVAALIREGKTSKDIADFLNVSLTTVITHRYNIRKKTGIKNKKMNLRAYLQTLE